jgi:hypothetical protein
MCSTFQIISVLERYCSIHFIHFNHCDHVVPYERLTYLLKAWPEDLIGFGSHISLFWACFYIIFPNLPNILLYWCFMTTTHLFVLLPWLDNYYCYCSSFSCYSLTLVWYAGSFDPMTCSSELCGLVAVLVWVVFDGEEGALIFSLYVDIYRLYFPLFPLPISWTVVCHWESLWLYFPWAWNLFYSLNFLMINLATFVYNFNVVTDDLDFGSA